MRCRVCGADGARPYGTGLCCPAHTPAAAAGRPEPPNPDPALTLDGLQRRAGRAYHYRATDTALNDERALKSGRRRAGRSNYLRTQKALAEVDLARERGDGT